MSYTLKTGAVTKEHDIGNDADFINVPFQIFNNDNVVVFEAAHAFPLDTSEEDIRAALGAALASVLEKEASHADSVAAQEAHDNASKTVEALTGLEITQ